MHIATIRSKQELQKNLPGSKETPHWSNILKCSFWPIVIFMAKCCQDNEEINNRSKKKPTLCQTEVVLLITFFLPH